MRDRFYFFAAHVSVGAFGCLLAVLVILLFHNPEEPMKYLIPKTIQADLDRLLPIVQEKDLEFGYLFTEPKDIANRAIRIGLDVLSEMYAAEPKTEEGHD